MTELLRPYTLRELEAASSPKEKKPEPPKTHLVKIDQADLFNDQGALFGHTVQPGDLT